MSLIKGLDLIRYLTSLVTRLFLVDEEYKLDGSSQPDASQVDTSYGIHRIQIHHIEYILSNTTYVDTHYRIQHMWIHIIDHAYIYTYIHTHIYILFRIIIENTKTRFSSIGFACETR